MKKLLSIFITILMISTLFVFTASADERASIAFSPQTITIGDKVVVTVTINPGTKLYAVGFNLVYDAEKLSYEGAAGVIKVVESPSGTTKFTQQFTFQSTAVGNASIKVEECGYAGEDLVDKTFGGASAYLTIKDVALPSNTKLNSFAVNGISLSTTKTDQTVSVPYTTEKVTFTVKTNDNKAKVTGIEPNMSVKVGTNNFKITVTAQDGSQKVYTVRITRKSDDTTIVPDNTPDVSDNPYETVISGTTYEVLTKLPETHPFKGFSATNVEFNGQQVPVLTNSDNSFSIYYLKSTESQVVAPYVLNSELETFEQLKYYVSGNNTYIFTDFPEGAGMDDNYYSTYTQIGDFSVASYADTNSQMSDFVYVYCFANNKYGLYRFDTKEGTIQRYPDTLLVDKPVADKPIQDNFLTRFGNLSTNGKILLISMLIAAVSVVLLIIFIIISAIKKFSNKAIEIEDTSDQFDFDDVVVVGDETVDLNQK